jgi:hypothetical protein
MVDGNEDVSTTDDEFPTPLSTDDDRSKQKTGRQGEGETRRQRNSCFLSSLSLSPLILVSFSYPPRIVKFARQMYKVRAVTLTTITARSKT